MSALREFLAMGGYAGYVWTAYGLSALVLALNTVLPLAREKRLLRELRAREALISQR